MTYGNQLCYLFNIKGGNFMNNFENQDSMINKRSNQGPRPAPQNVQPARPRPMPPKPEKEYKNAKFLATILFVLSGVAIACFFMLAMYSKHYNTTNTDVKIKFVEFLLETGVVKNMAVWLLVGLSVVFLSSIINIRYGKTVKSNCVFVLYNFLGVVGALAGMVCATYLITSLKLTMMGVIWLGFLGVILLLQIVEFWLNKEN